MSRLSVAAALAALSIACHGSKGSDNEPGERQDIDNADSPRVDATVEGSPRSGPEGGARSDASLDAGRKADARAVQSPADAEARDGAATPSARADGCPVDAPLPLNRVRIYPATGAGSKLVGARIQGSNSGPTTDFEDVATIERAPADGEFTEIEFANQKLFRFVRYFDAAATPAAIAELEFYNGQTRLVGKTFGTTNPDGKSPFSNAFDGDVATSFAGATMGGNYVGLDIAGEYIATAPTFSPAPGALRAASDVTIATTTKGAKVRYTLDGAAPSSAEGLAYEKAIRVDVATMNIKAVAYAPCYFESPVASAMYTIGAPMAGTRGQKSYHIGNSLTDTVNEWLEPIADSTGVDHQYARWTLPGTPIAYLWNYRNTPPPGESKPLKEQAFGTPPAAADFDNFVKTFSPIDHLSVQPFADPVLATQGGAAVEIFRAAKAASPDLQFWIYWQWPNKDPQASSGDGWMMDGFARGASHAMWPAPDPSVPLGTWEDTARAQGRYHEAFRQFVDDAVDGKKVLIIPGGLALAQLKQEIDQGRVPGMNEFFSSIFEDYLHLKPAGQYLVSLVFYACMYKQTPEGRVTVKPDGMTAEQAQIFQRLAWQVASGYPLSGIMD
jgi:hypothetical protein